MATTAVMARHQTKSGWMGGLVCGALLAVAPPYAILLAGCLLPGLAAWVFLPERPRRTAQAMLLFGLATSCAPLRRLWDGGGGLAVAWSQLTDPLPLAIAWFAAAFGWALAELLPLAAAAALEFEAQRQRTSLQKARRRVVDGWELREDG